MVGKLALFLVLVPSIAFAQQQLDPAVLQRIIPSLQQQRNEALDRAALAEARAAELAEEVAKLKAAAPKDPPKK